MHLLFDLDGTLTDSRPGIIGSIQHALAENDFPIPAKDELNWFIGPPILESFRTITREHPYLFDATVTSYRDRYGRLGLFENSVYPGIESLLGELQSRGHTLHVATSKAGVYAAPIIARYGLDRYFKSVHGSELDGTRADKSELIAHVLRSENIRPEKALMIGDRRHDMVGARNNSLPAIGVLWGYGSEEELREAGAFDCVSLPAEIAALPLLIPV